MAAIELLTGPSAQPAPTTITDPSGGANPDLVLKAGVAVGAAIASAPLQLQDSTGAIIAAIGRRIAANGLMGASLVSDTNALWIDAAPLHLNDDSGSARTTTIGGLVTIRGCNFNSLDVSAIRHLTCSQAAAPTVAAGAQGSAQSMGAGSTDSRGIVNVTSTITPGILAVVTFAVAYGAAPIVLLSSLTLNPGIFYVSATATNSFTISSAGGVTAVAQQFAYHVIG